MELKKIGVLSLAKIAGLFGVIYGFVSGILIVIIVSKVPTVAEQLGIVSQWGAKSIIILPIINGATYFIAGIILAFIYNLITSWVGGIKVDLGK